MCLAQLTSYLMVALSNPGISKPRKEVKTGTDRTMYVKYELGFVDGVDLMCQAEVFIVYTVMFVSKGTTTTAPGYRNVWEETTQSGSMCSCS